MKYLIICLALVSCETTQVTKHEGKTYLARTTQYWPSERGDSDTTHHRSATGIRLREGMVAVDPRIIPYGSTVRFPSGETFLALDTGTAVKNRKAARLSGKTEEEKKAIVVDRFFESKRAALEWARRNPPFLAVSVIP